MGGDAIKNLKIILLICPNGFGHFRRMNLIINILKKKKINFQVHTNKNLFFKFLYKSKIKIDNFKIVDLPWLPTLESYQKKNEKLDLKFKQYSHKYRNYDIISDNYPEILVWHKRSHIIANFFWHNYYYSKLNKINTKILNQKIFENSNNIYTNYLFSNLKNVNKKIINKVGFFGNKVSNKSIKRRDIYFVKGFGYQSLTFDKLILNFIKTQFKSNDKLKFDINFNKKMFSQFNFINLNNSNFNKIKLVIGRPSLGILSECFLRKIPFYPIYEKKDKESNVNTKMLMKYYNLNKLKFEINNLSKKIYSKNICINGEKKVLDKIIK